MSMTVSVPSKHRPDFKVGEVLAGMTFGVRDKEVVANVLPFLEYREQATYQFLHRILNDERGDDLHSKQILANELGKSESSVGASLAKLVALKLIRREQRGRHGVVTVMLLPPRNFKGSVATEPSHKSRGPSDGSQGVRVNGSRGPSDLPLTGKRTGKRTGNPQTPVVRSAGGSSRSNGSAERNSSSTRAKRQASPPATTKPTATSARAAGPRSPRARARHGKKPVRKSKNLGMRVSLDGTKTAEPRSNGHSSPYNGQEPSEPRSVMAAIFAGKASFDGEAT